MAGTHTHYSLWPFWWVALISVFYLTPSATPPSTTLFLSLPFLLPPSPPPPSSPSSLSISFPPSLSPFLPLYLPLSHAVPSLLPSTQLSLTAHPFQLGRKQPVCAQCSLAGNCLRNELLGREKGKLKWRCPLFYMLTYNHKIHAHMQTLRPIFMTF